MVKFLLKSLIKIIVIWIIAGFIIFLFLNLAPQELKSDYFNNKFTPSDLIKRFFLIIRDTFKLELGFYEGVPIKNKILFGLKNSLIILIGATILALIGGVFLGIIFVKYRQSKVVNLIKILTDGLSFIPSYIMAYFISAFLVAFFKITTDFNFAYQKGMFFVILLFFLSFLILALNDGTLSELIRKVQSELLKGRESLYIKVVEANGGNVLSHMLRTAFVQILIALNLRAIHFTGVIIVIENIFTLKGLGWLILDGIKSHNYTIVFVTSIILVALVLIINFISELLIYLINPFFLTKRNEKNI